MQSRNLIKTVKLVTVIATCFLVVLLGVIIGQYIKLGNLKKTNENLSSALANKEAYRRELNSSITARKSSTYIELQAREQLGLIKEGESLYIYE